MPTFNFDAVETAEPTRLEPGDYTATVREVRDVVSQGGTEGVELDLWLEQPRRKWSTTLWLSPAAAPYSKERVETILGGPVPKGKAFDFGALIGRRAVAVLREKMNQNTGKTYLEVVGFNPLPKGEADPLEAAVANAVSTFGDGTLPVGDDSDIPFAASWI